MSHPAEILAGTAEPFQEFFRERLWRRNNDTLIGLNAEGFVYAASDTNVGGVGPSRSKIGKSGSLGTAALVHNGPLVAMGDKYSLYTALALARSAVGPVFHIDVDGSGVMQGAQEARISLVTETGGDPDKALVVAEQIVGAGKPEGTNNDTFWRHNATDLAASLFVLVFFMNTTDRDARVADIVSNPNFREIAEQCDKLVSQHPHLRHVTDTLMGICTMPEATRGGIFATVRAALRFMQSPAIRRSTSNPNFSIAKLVAGKPNQANYNLAFLDGDREATYIRLGSPPVGVYSTLFVLTRNTQLFAPYLAAIASLIRIEAEKHMAEHYDENPVDVMFFFDELAHATPITNIGSWLTRGNTGITVVGLFQDLQQLKEKWGDDAGKALLSEFQNLIVIRGIRDRELGDTLTYFSETYQDINFSDTWGYGQENPTWGGSTGFVDRNVLRPDMISNGHPHYPQAALLFAHNEGRHQWVHLTPWFKSAPWPQMLLTEAERVLASGSDRARFPLPPFEYRGRYADLPSHLLQRYIALKSRWNNEKAA